MLVTKVYKALHVLFFSSLQMCVPTLWIYFILFFSTPDKRCWICGQHSVCFQTAVNVRYLLKLYKVLMAFSWFWRCHILSRCRLEKPPPHPPPSSQSTLIQSSNLLVQLWPQLTSAFSRILGDKRKDHMQTGNDRLALGLLQREKPTLPQLNLF